MIYNLSYLVSITPSWLLAVLGFLMAFYITGKAIPSIVTVADLKGLCDTPNHRTSHSSAIPTLGGIAIFVGFLVSTAIFAGHTFHADLGYIIAGLLIIFIIGVKDDILILDPKKKLIAQVMVALLFALFADLKISNLHGLFGINEIPYVIAIGLTVFVFIVVDNGFNLIDGIDGLSSGVGALTSLTMGFLLWKSGDTPYMIMSFSFTGALIAFFRFNVFSKMNKIFLGDTGSLIIGMVLSILTVKFLQDCALLNNGEHVFMQSAPAVVIGILIIPLFDTLRIFYIRMRQGKSPFTPDRQHIHHRLLQLKFTHLQSTLILLGVNALFIVSVLLLQGVGIIWLTGILLAMASLLSYVLMTYVKHQAKEPVMGRYVKVRKPEVIFRHRRLERYRINAIQNVEQKEKERERELEPTLN